MGLFMSKKKIVLIDGHSILTRAFFGVPDLTNVDGLHTNAVYGFLNIMFKILEEEKPDGLFVAFDVKAPTFRHKMYDGYKELRPKFFSMQDRLRELGDKLQADSLSLGADTTQLLADARAALDGLSETSGSNAASSSFDSLRDFLSFRAEVNEGRRKTVKAGFPSLDGILGGFAQGGLYVIAARPGVGKSALGIALADMIARETTVLYASLEMSGEELNSRRVAAFSTAPCTFGKLLFGKTTEVEDAAIINACGVLAERELHILAVPTLTVPQLEIQARNVHAQVVMVDYLGLLSTADRRASEYERVTQVSGDLKRMAKRMNCVVIALCQLNREATTASVDSRPKLSQLRSSGAIEQDADGVLLLHRPEYGQSETQRNPAEPQEFFIDVAKNRHGRTGTAELAWYAPVNRFVDNAGKWEVRSWA